MNLETKRIIIHQADKRRNHISDSKASEYTGSGSRYGEDDQDVLANFKRVGERQALDPLTVLGVYLGKHVDSLYTFLAEYSSLDQDGRVALAKSGEGIISRLDDLRNYADLFECLLADEGCHPDGWFPDGSRMVKKVVQGPLPGMEPPEGKIIGYGKDLGFGRTLPASVLPSAQTEGVRYNLAPWHGCFHPSWATDAARGLGRPECRCAEGFCEGYDEVGLND